MTSLIYNHSQLKEHKPKTRSLSAVLFIAAKP
nr:hypothetical protein REQ54_04360 [Rhizobium sp. Q54]